MYTQNLDRNRLIKHQNFQNLNSFCGPKAKILRNTFSAQQKKETFQSPPLPQSFWHDCYGAHMEEAIPLFIQNMLSPHYYMPTSACLPPLTLELHFGLQKHVLPKLKPFFSQAKVTVIFQEGEKCITKTLSPSCGCNKPTLKGSTDFYTSHSKFDNEEVKNSKAPSDISTTQAQFPKVRTAETTKS